MALFLSQYSNRIDRKGRVCVPASFRATLGEDATGIIVFRSLQHRALDGCSVDHLEILSQSLEKLSLPPETLEVIETTIFGGAVSLPFDGDGRVVLPSALIEAVGISDEVVFVGRRRTFQIWNPKDFAAYDQQARTSAQAHDISLSKIIAEALSLRTVRVS